MKLQKKTDYVLLAIILLSLAILLWRFGKGSLFSAGVRGGNNELRQRMNIEQRLLKQSAEIKARTKELEEALLAWEAFFYQTKPEDAMVELVSTVDRLTDISGFSIKEKQLHWDLSGPNDWSKIGVTISGRTGFRELIRFTNEILSFDHLIVIDKIQIQADQPSRLLSYHLTLTTLAKKAD